MIIKRACKVILWLVILAGWLPCRADDTNDPSVLWKFRLPDLRSDSSPAVGLDGTIFQGTFFGWMWAVTPDGKEKWRFKAGLEIMSSPAVADDGTIYFGSRDRCFYALTPAGKLKWKFKTGAWVDSSPAIAKDGTVYFGSWDQQFYALNPDGVLKWKFATDGIVFSSPAIGADGTIYFGSFDKQFYALTAEGKLKWKFATQGEIKSSPAIGPDGAVYFQSGDGNFYALNSDGTRRWQLRTGDYQGASPVLDETGILYLTINRKLASIQAGGQLRWQTSLPEPLFPSVAGVALPSGRSAFGFPWGCFGVRDDRGYPVWQVWLKGSVHAAPNITSDGIAYVCNQQALWAIKPATNSLVPANSSWPQWRANPQHTGRVKSMD